MKNSRWIVRFCFISCLFLINGCQHTKDAELISFKQPKHPVRVETENFRWDTASEQDQELADEI